MADHNTTANKSDRQYNNCGQRRICDSQDTDTSDSDEGKLTYQAFNMEGGVFLFCSFFKDGPVFVCLTEYLTDSM